MRHGTDHKKIDYTTILIYALIVIFGWINIYAACYNEAHSSIFDFGVQHGKQLMWIGVASFFAIVIMLTEPRVISNGAYIIYALVLLMLAATLVVGRSVNGGQSWIEIGPVRIQSSEFAKFATALALAKYVSNPKFDIRHHRSWIALLTLIALPAGLILLQNDTGSAIVFAAFAVAFYRFGMKPNIIIFGAALVVLFLLSLSVKPFWLTLILLAATLFYLYAHIGKPKLKHYLIAVAVLAVCGGFIWGVDYAFHEKTWGAHDHQRTRILVMLDPDLDKTHLGDGYNVYQSKIAIGSGGLTGKGFLNGTLTKANFVPEQETDFIFCTVGEEWGFLGGSALLLLYMALLVRLVGMAERQASAFARFYGYCVSGILFFHIVVNVGMVLGWMPVIGIPLPFFSYGGSSLLAFTILLFIFIRQDASRTAVL